MLADVGSVQALLGQVQTILNVDINATDISADLAVGRTSLYIPGPSLTCACTSIPILCPLGRVSF